MVNQPLTLMDAIKFYSNYQNCHNFLVSLRWPESLLKRALNGTYVSVEPFHLFRYLDEQAYRYNLRKGRDGDRFITAVDTIVGRRLTYKELTGKHKRTRGPKPKAKAA